MMVKSMFSPSERESLREHYDLANVIKALAGDPKVDIGYEREISKEINRRRGGSLHGGFAVPYAVFRRAISKLNSPGLVATDTLLDETVSPLEPLLVTSRLGARVIDGLVGDVAIPKGAAAEVNWITVEGGSAAEAYPESATAGTIIGTPHTLAAKCDVTRTLDLQTAGAVEDFIASSIAASISRAIDRAALVGTGAGGQPLGIVGTDGVHNIDGITPGSPTRANLLAFLSALDDANVDTDAAAWVAPSAVKTKLQGTLDAVAGNRYLCEGGDVLGHRIATSNLAPAKKLMLGKWDELLILGWGDAIDIVRDRSTLAISGGVRLSCFKDVDIAVRHPSAFAVGTVLA